MEFLFNKINSIESFNAVSVPKEYIPDEEFGDKVIYYLKNSTFFIPIFSIGSYTTQWINQEVGFAKALKNINNQIIIIPVIQEEFLDSEHKLKGFINIGRDDIFFKTDNSDFDQVLDKVTTILEKHKDLLEYHRNNQVVISVNKKHIRPFVDSDTLKIVKMFLGCYIQNKSSNPIIITELVFKMYLKETKYESYIYDDNEICFKTFSVENKEHKGISPSGLKLSPNDNEFFELKLHSEKIFIESQHQFERLLRNNIPLLDKIEALIETTDGKFNISVKL